MRVANHHSPRPPAPVAAPGVKTPYFQARNHARYLELEILLPDVAPGSIEVTVDAGDLTVTAHKVRAVRANWQAANFEAVEHDYLLRFPLGREFDVRAIKTRMQDGILRVRLPKMGGCWPRPHGRKQQ